MKRLLPLAALVLSTVVMAGCAQSTDTATSETSGVPSVVRDDDPLRIVAATELRDLEAVVEQASGDLGFTIELEFPGGTLENSERLKQGDFDDDVDATWFATNRYVDLIGASDKLGEATKIASSPVALGVAGDHARRLARLPVSSLRAVKRTMTEPLAGQIAEARARENQYFAELMGGPANAEALAAFAEGRPADFTNLPNDS